MQITLSEEISHSLPVTVFHITGPIDAASCNELERQARETYQNGTERLLLDLTDVNYVGSSALGAISTIFNLLRSGTSEESDDVIRKGLQEGTFKSSLLKIVCPNDSVKQVLALSGYDKFLEIHKDLPEALRSF